MERIEYQDPLPNWTTVIISWDDILNPPYYPIREILDWMYATSGGRYHLSGYNQTEGFEFRFEDPRDATYFKLKWM